MKAICSAHINKRNWKQEMFKFLRQYRSAPHTSTGLTPYALLFNRNPWTKLPMIPIKTENTSLDEYVHNSDSEAKYKMKTSADMKNHAVNRDINVGDTVVVKRDIRGNKLDPKFDIEPKTVMYKRDQC